MRVPLHIVEARRQKIRALLKADKYLDVPKVCRFLGISEATARRDLAALVKEGGITRTHGGALSDFEENFPPFVERKKIAQNAKDRIAKGVFRLIRKDSCYFFDAGTTILAAATYLAAKPLVGISVVTNSFPIAEILSGKEGISVYLLGGQFLSKQAVLLGKKANQSLKLWNFDAAFLSAEGMTREGIWNTNNDVVSLQRVVLSRTERVYFCLDKNKLGHTTDTLLARWSEIPYLITDATQESLKKTGILLDYRKLTSV